MPSPTPYPTEHTFQEGVLADLPATSTPNTVLVDGRNLHLLNEGSQGEQQILQSDNGNRYVAGLPAGWVVLGEASFNNIAYFLLAEYQNDQATGRGQIGSFPSPEPAPGGDPLDEPPVSGRLLPRYRPFHNYQAQLAAGDAKVYPFEAAEFAFSLEHPLEVRVQPDYDGTVNVIFNDGRNPPRLINSRFAAQPVGTYRIIDRDGERDTNLYSPASFGDTMRLFQRSRSLVKLEFMALLDGGQVPGGMWTYYAAYVNQDGQATDVVAWSPGVPVFDGTHMGTIAGTSGATNRRVSLTLRGLDSGYQFLRLYGVHAGGLGGSEAITAYQLPDIRLSGNDTLSVVHTGYETLLEYDKALLSLKTGSIETFQAMDEVDKMLAFAGGTTAIYDDVTLRTFAQRICLWAAPRQLHCPGIEDDGKTMGVGRNDPFTPINFTLATADGRAGGYLNPWNVAYRLGYPTGEALAFGVVFRLLSGADSNVFPVRGHDHLGEQQAYALGAALDARGWQATGENIDGVFRFPQLNNTDYPGNIGAEGLVTILGIDFEVPPLTPEIRALAVGLYFVRLPRNADRIAQGYAVATLSSALVAPNDETYDHFDGALTFLDAPLNGRQHPNLKVVPAVAAITETSVSHVTSKNPEKHVIPFEFVTKTPAGRYVINPWRLAFYSPDTAANPDRLQTALEGRSLRMAHQATVFGRAVQFTINPNDDGRTTFKVWKTLSQSASFSFQARKMRSFWTEAGNPGTNQGGFSSQETKLMGKNHNDVPYMLHKSWDEYVGLLASSQLDDVLGKATFQQLANKEGTFGAGNSSGRVLAQNINQYSDLNNRPIALLVNLYPEHSDDDLLAATDFGARPRDVLRDLYGIDTQGYFPICPVKSWEELEAELSPARHLTCFGGDTYKGLSYRRLDTSLKASEWPFDSVSWTEQHIGQVLALVAESDVNPYAGRLREQQTRPGEGVARAWWAAIYEQAGHDAWLATSDSFKAMETRGYNAGFGHSSGYTLQLSLPRNLPFRATTFPNQVAVTAPHLAGSFQNGYRRYVPGSAQTYSPELGPILGMRAVGRTLVLGHAQGVSSVAVNQRTQAGGDEAGAVFLEVSQVLSPYNTVLSRAVGTLSHLTMIATDSLVFGLDYGGVWRVQPGASGLELISSLRIDKLILAKLRLLGSHRATHILRRQAKLALDTGRGDLVVSLFNNAWAPPAAGALLTEDPYYEPLPGELGQPPALPPVPVFSLPPPDAGPNAYNWSEATCFQVVFSYQLNKWLPPTSYRAQHHFSLAERLYSVPLPGLHYGQRPGVYAHLGNYGFYYDQPHEAWLEFVVLGSGPGVQHILDNLLLLSNEVYPERIEYTPLDAQPTQQLLVGPAPGNISRRNAEYREDRLWVTVSSDMRDQRQRARAIRVRIVYPGQQRLLLTAVLAFLKDSYA